jgi:hypothetical protein
MTERQLFSVVVRGFGFWSLFLGLSAVFSIVQFYGMHGLQAYDWQPAGAFAAVYFLVGLALLRQADTITEFVYRVAKSVPQDSN